MDHKPCGIAAQCVGPRNGEPVCYCQMQYVRIIDGRYIMQTDLGPAPSDIPAQASPQSELPIG